MEQHYRTRDVCTQLSVSRSTLWRMRRETGCGPSIVIGARLKLWSEDDVVALLAALKRRRVEQ